MGILNPYLPPAQSAAAPWPSNLILPGLTRPWLKDFGGWRVTVYAPAAPGQGTRGQYSSAGKFGRLTGMIDSKTFNGR